MDKKSQKLYYMLKAVRANTRFILPQSTTALQNQSNTKLTGESIISKAKERKNGKCKSELKDYASYKPNAVVSYMKLTAKPNKLNTNSLQRLNYDCITKPQCHVNGLYSSGKKKGVVINGGDFSSSRKGKVTLPKITKHRNKSQSKELRYKLMREIKLQSTEHSRTKSICSVQLTEDELKKYGKRFPDGYKRLGVLGK